MEDEVQLPDWAPRENSGTGAAPPRDISPPACLNESQELRLINLLSAEYPINSVDMPTLFVRASTFTTSIRNRITSKGIEILDVRLNGSAASFVVAEPTPCDLYNDLDFLFLIKELPTRNVHEMLEDIRLSFFECLLELIPVAQRPTNIGGDLFILQSYVHKMFKVPSKFITGPPSADVWSLITLNSDENRNLEYKFVLKLDRGYEFSIDSLQISLNQDFLAGCDVSLGDNATPALCGNIQLLSVYGDVQEVLDHLSNRWICTRNPEAIRGGGLLKYCYLVAQGYRPIYCDSAEIVKLELYMSNRFLIDYSTEHTIHFKLANYFLVRLRREPNFCRISLIVLRDILKRCQTSEWPMLRKIVDSIIVQLPHMAPLDPSTMPRVTSKPPPQSILLEAAPLGTSPLPPIIDSFDPVPLPLLDVSSSISAFGPVMSPWGTRPFSEVVSLPSRAGQRAPQAIFPAALTVPTTPNAPSHLATGSISAPSSPAKPSGNNGSGARQNNRSKIRRDHSDDTRSRDRTEPGNRGRSRKLDLNSLSKNLPRP